MNRMGIAVLVAASMIGCSKPDPRRQKLVGDWKEDAGTFSLHEDGTFSGDFRPPPKLPDAPRSIHMAGSWKLSGNDLTLNIEQSTYRSDKIVGNDDTERVLDIGPDTFTTVNKAGKESTYKRIKK